MLLRDKWVRGGVCLRRNDFRLHMQPLLNRSLEKDTLQTVAYLVCSLSFCKLQSPPFVTRFMKPEFREENT